MKYQPRKKTLYVPVDKHFRRRMPSPPIRRSGKFNATCTYYGILSSIWGVTRGIALQVIGRNLCETSRCTRRKLSFVANFRWSTNALYDGDRLRLPFATRCGKLWRELYGMRNDCRHVAMPAINGVCRNELMRHGVEAICYMRILVLGTIANNSNMSRRSLHWVNCRGWMCLRSLQRRPILLLQTRRTWAGVQQRWFALHIHVDGGPGWQTRTDADSRVWDSRNAAAGYASGASRDMLYVCTWNWCLLFNGWNAQRSHEAENWRCYSAHVHKSIVPILLAFTHEFLDVAWSREMLLYVRRIQYGKQHVQRVVFHMLMLVRAHQ